jgi:hypothetical protein
MILFCPPPFQVRSRRGGRYVTTDECTGLHGAGPEHASDQGLVMDGVVQEDTGCAGLHGHDVLCKQRVETRLGDEVDDNGTRLPALSLDVRGPLACANIALAGTAARPDKAEVSSGAGSGPARS